MTAMLDETGSRDDDIRGADPRTSPSSRLYILSVAYFAAPCFVFLFGFTRLWVALIVGGGLAATCAFEARRELGERIEVSAKRRDWIGFALIIAAAALWTALFGAGFVGFQTGDQLKNHVIFRDLVSHSWPVVYSELPPEMRFLSYPLGYYLVPALIGKLFGWAIGTMGLYVWAAMGVALVWSWIRLLFDRFAIVAIAIVVFFSGLDILGWLAQGQGLPAAGTHLEWWAGWTFLQYSSNATVMSWSTQHGAAQWLLPMLLWYRLVLRKDVRGAALLVSIAAFWSHLTLVGLAVFLPLLFREGRIGKAVKDASLLALPFLLVVASFYTSKAPGVIKSGFLWDLWPLGQHGASIVLFVVFEFALLALFIHSVRRFEDADEKRLFVASVVLLLVVPAYHVGWSNDVSMRVSAIPLFILFLFFSSTVRELIRERRKAALAAAALYMLLAGFTSGNEMVRQAQALFPARFSISDLTDSTWQNGVNRRRRNCFVTSVPADFELVPGDRVSVEGVGTFAISDAGTYGNYESLCVSPASARIRQLPADSRSLRFFRDGAELRNRAHVRALQAAEDLPGVAEMWPEQYTGSAHSLFFRHLLDVDR